MSVTEKGITSATGEVCFFCGAVIEHDPVLHWGGATADIYLHADCFVNLATRLFCDLHELRDIYGYEKDMRAEMWKRQFDAAMKKIEELEKKLLKTQPGS